jgi:hypothetical protein
MIKRAKINPPPVLKAKIEEDFKELVVDSHIPLEQMFVSIDLESIVDSESDYYDSDDEEDLT